MLRPGRDKPATPTTQTTRRFADLPQPKGWPLVGNAFQVSSSRIHLDVEAWARQLGPLFRLKLGRTWLLVVADHELLSKIMRDRPEGFRRSPLGSRISIEMGLPQGVFSAEGEDWRRQRRMVMASFASGHVRAYFPTMVKVTQRLHGRWRKAAQGSHAINLQADLMRYTVDTVAGLAFGKDINTLESGEDVIQRHLDKVLPAIFRRALMLLPYWRWFKLPADRELDRSVSIINETITGFVGQARQRLRDDPTLRTQPRNLLEAMVVAADQPDSGLGDAEVVGNVLTMLLAGEDTTANTLAWMIHLLQLNPDAMRRVRDEVRELAPDLMCTSPESLDRLEFLDACISETLRLKPTAPFIGLQALRDTMVGDVAVPRHTLIWGVLRKQSISEPYFVEPMAFRPQRWLADAESPLSAAARRAAVPFGSGPRICPGRYLALLEMKLAMVMLLARFDILSVDTPDGRPAQERMAFAMGPVGLSMRLRERG